MCRVDDQFINYGQIDFHLIRAQSKARLSRTYRPCIAIHTVLQCYLRIKYESVIPSQTKFTEPKLIEFENWYENVGQWYSVEKEKNLP